ncbi:hypothetical protein SPI_01455 [Niveomyces insectorum RCEF 264]|uniref:Uncharacterized protein n=1 Tax=Niveomyces insectorum RCEF 264 TaxID=1081102 RepID=A0A167YZD3_9HYPO|nr:hypothetical protein SPI_01455 [Niveomyces insectorum RCEF 264]
MDYAKNSEEPEAIQSVRIVNRNEYDLIEFRSTQTIATSGLDGCFVVAITSEVGAILARIARAPVGADGKLLPVIKPFGTDVWAWDTAMAHVAEKTLDLMSFYRRYKNTYIFQPSLVKAFVFSPGSKPDQDDDVDDDVLVPLFPEEQDFLTTMLQWEGLYPTEELYEVGAASEPGAFPGLGTARVTGPETPWALPKTYLEEEFQG